MTEKRKSLQEITELLEQVRESKDRLLTGFREFDALTGGLIKGGLTVVGARPAMGKTALALSIAELVSKQMEGTVVIFSPNVCEAEVAARFLQTGMSIEVGRLLDGSLNAQEAAEACRDFFASRRGKFKINPSTYPGLESIKTYCQKIPDLCLVIVDNMKYIYKPDTSAETVAHEPEFVPMDQSASALKTLAQDLGVPVLCTANMHRRLERRKNKRPHLGDLKWIGLTEETVDQIIFLYRDNYYNWQSDNTVECIVAKNTRGNTGTAFLRWIWAGGYITDQ